MATQTGTTGPLEMLCAELDGRGWKAQLQQRGTVLYVRNPNVPALDDRILCGGGAFRWSWQTGGQCIGPAADVAAAADHITHVLRDPGTEGFGS